jgi:hypothetical protein
MEFFLSLVIFSDYFLLNRMMQLSSNYVKKYLNKENVFNVLLVAHAHNAYELENYCLNYICLNELINSNQWNDFKKYASKDLLVAV